MSADIISWNRLEPHPRTDDQNAAVATGLEARVHDPLWLLGRQWQFREFEGEDAGSPVTVRLQLATTSLTRWSPSSDGTAPAAPLDVTAQPLEALVEREAMPFVGVRTAAQAGLHFLALLERAGRAALKDAYIAAYPLAAPADRPSDPLSGRMLRVLAGRAPDGARLAGDLAVALRAAVPALPAQPAVGAADRDAVLAVAQAWLGWYESEVAPPTATDAWVPERLEYRFSVGACAPDGAGETVLAAPDYRGDGLDWYDFVHQPGRTLGAPAQAPQLRTWTGLPAPVTFRGMPAARWWEFEDAGVDLGAVDTAPDDLARLLVTEFTTVYGNDWYQVPVDVSIGTLTSVVSLVVTNSFGERHLIEPTARARTEGGPWRMFHVSEETAGRGAGANLEALFLPPVVAAQLDGAPIEDVLFARDEMADMAWAIERVVQGASGRASDRAEEWQRGLAAAAAAAAAAGGEPQAPIAPLRYQLATSVPDYWIPLIPVHDGTPRGVRLERGAMLHFDGGSTTAVEPRGTLLTVAKPPLRFYEEEVPREGRRVQRVAVLTRWYGGTTHSWIARRSRVGRGESSSGLRYDWAAPTAVPMR